MHLRLAAHSPHVVFRSAARGGALPRGPGRAVAVRVSLRPRGSPPRNARPSSDVKAAAVEAAAAVVAAVEAAAAAVAARLLGPAHPLVWSPRRQSLDDPNL